MMPPDRQRIGLYGGAFDPPHNAHVALAAAAVQQLALDLLYVIPTGQPWMKQRRLTAAVHRLAMAQLAFAGVPKTVVDDCELRRSTTTYTIDTLRELQARPAHAGGETDWFLVMGEDLLRTLPQWWRAEDLLREVTVAVLARPDAAGGQSGELQPPAGVHAVPLHLPASAISATLIRQGLQQRAALAPQERLAWLQPLVPQPVAQYIDDHQLYLTPHAN